MEGRQVLTSKFHILDGLKVPRMCVGSTREQECLCCKQVEWDFYCGTSTEEPPVRDYVLTSPMFRIGNQQYFLDYSDYEVFRPVHLFRMGPSCPTLSVRYWLGLKLSDGTYDHKIESSELNLGEKFELWKEVHKYDSPRSELKRWNAARDGRLTIFLRMNTGAETCTHGQNVNCIRGPSSLALDLPLPSTGSIRKEECPCHEQAEWDVDYEALLKSDSLLTSPDFEIGGQTYLLEFRGNNNLHLFRMGPRVDGPVGSLRWWAGLKLGHGAYHNEVATGRLRLTEERELWGDEKILYFSFKFEKMRHLTRDGRLTFFVRMKEDGTPTAECTPGGTDISPWSVGRLDQEEWTSYKHMKWYVDYDPALGPAISPVFAAGTQSCLLQLSPESLAFYWMGPSVDKAVRWWATVKSDDGTCPYDSSCSRMNLEEVSEMWTRQWLLTFGTKLDEKTRLTVDFLMTLNADAYSVGACTDVDVHALQDLKSLREEYVLFHVKDKVFKMHRSILRIRVPVMEAMFRYDYIENGTGVVRVEDCEPDIFQKFLHFVYFETLEGKLKQYASDLYVLADRYLFDQLKAQCLDYIKRNFTTNTFFDFLTLALRYDEKCLLRKAALFISENRNIAETEDWRDFCVENPDAADDLMKTASKLDDFCKTDLRRNIIINKRDSIVYK